VAKAASSRWAGDADMHGKRLGDLTMAKKGELKKVMAGTLPRKIGCSP